MKKFRKTLALILISPFLFLLGVPLVFLTIAYELLSNGPRTAWQDLKYLWIQFK